MVMLVLDMDLLLGKEVTLMPSVFIYNDLYRYDPSNDSINNVAISISSRESTEHNFHIKGRDMF